MNIRANLNRLFEERTLRVNGDRSPKGPTAALHFV